MLNNIDSYAFGAASIVLIVFVSVMILLFIRRKLKVTNNDQHEVGGHYFSAIGTLYAVILGLVVVDSSSKFNEARMKTINEVDALAEVYALAEIMPPEKRQSIKDSVSEYVNHAASDGWVNLQSGIYDSVEASEFDDIIIAARSVEPVTENQKALFPIMITSVITASESRQARINTEQYELPDIEWFSLITGGIATIGFTFFFSIESLIAQAIMTGVVAFVLSLNLYVAFLYDTPYSGALQVKNTQFMNLQEYIKSHP